MVAEIRVTGAEQLRKLGADLKAAGESGKGLRRELRTSLRVAAKPLTELAKRSAMDHLPKAGGLNEFIASSKFAARTSMAGSRAGLRIVASKAGGRKGSHDLEAFDRGEFRHPVYGRWLRDVPAQSIEPGWFSKPLEDATPLVRDDLLAAMTVIAQRIEKGTI